MLYTIDIILYIYSLFYWIFFLSRDFIKSLATFNKPIVAGVQGAAIGLGVTMLPLFDLVIASDKATFCTPYGKLGQIAEGAAVFTLSHILGSAIVSCKQLFIASIT